MKELEKIVQEILDNSSVPQEKKAEFKKYVLNQEKKAKRIRYLNPVIYLLIGVTILIVIFMFKIMGAESASKFAGVLFALFAAILAFYKPTVKITQDECQKHLEKLLPSVDIDRINSQLKVAPEELDRVLKLISAAVSYIAIFLLTFD